MQVVALISQKGGSGKTTTAIHLAVASHLAGKQVLLIDLDPQASASKWKDLRTNDAPVVISAQASRLAQTLETAHKANADLVFIDTPPHSDGIALATMRASDLILIPCRPSILDLQAIKNTIDLVQTIKKRAFVVFTAVPIQGSLATQATEAITPLGVEVCPHKISQRATFQHALTAGKSAQEYERSGKASEETAALYEWLAQVLS